MKFEKLIQIMEARGVEVPEAVIEEPVSPNVEDIVKTNFGILLNDKFFNKQFRQIVSAFMDSKRELLKQHKDAKSLHANKQRLEKRQSKYEQDITKLATKLKDNTRVINHSNMSPGEKELLEREIGKLEAELKIANEQLGRKPHGNEIVKLIKQHAIWDSKLSKYPVDAPQYQKVASKVEAINGKLNSGKFAKSQGLISKVLKGSNRLSKMTDKFKNSNSNPKLLSKIKSEIFDLNKTLNVKEKEYDKIMSELSEVINTINTINSGIEEINTDASDKIKALIPFTANMLLKSRGDFDDSKMETLNQLANDDPNTNPILNSLTEYENEYNNFYGGQDLNIKDFNRLPFYQLLNVFKQSRVIK